MDTFLRPQVVIPVLILLALGVLLLRTIQSGRFGLKKIQGYRSDVVVLGYITQLHNQSVNWVAHTNITGNISTQREGMTAQLAEPAIAYLVFHRYVDTRFRVTTSGNTTAPTVRPSIDANLKGAVLWATTRSETPRDFGETYIWSILRTYYGANYLPTKQMLGVVLDGLIRTGEYEYSYMLTAKGSKYLSKKR
jgi:hypothetical protein